MHSTEVLTICVESAAAHSQPPARQSGRDVLWWLPSLEILANSGRYNTLVCLNYGTPSNDLGCPWLGLIFARSDTRLKVPKVSLISLWRSPALSQRQKLSMLSLIMFTISMCFRDCQLCNSEINILIFGLSCVKFYPCKYLE